MYETILATTVGFDGYPDLIMITAHKYSYHNSDDTTKMFVIRAI